MRTFILAAMLLLTLSASAQQPTRLSGICVFHHSEQSARTQGKSPGYAVFIVSAEGTNLVFRTGAGLLSFYRERNETIRSHGLWISHEDLRNYTDHELRDLGELKDVCLRDAIPLFICRGGEEPKGWRRVE